MPESVVEYLNKYPVIRWVIILLAAGFCIAFVYFVVKSIIAGITSRSFLNRIDNMEGHDFEYFCARFLKKMGFKKVSVTAGSGDDGIDILAVKDGVRYGIQCKRSSTPIGNKAVQEAYTGKAMYECDVVAVLTNNYFTKSAINTAENVGVELWDRDFMLENK